MGPGIHRGIPGAGAGDGPGQDRHRGGPGGRAGRDGRPRGVQRHLDEVHGAHGRRRDEPPHRAPGGTDRTHRAPGRLGDRREAGTGDGRPPVPALGREGPHAFRRRKAPCGAVPPPPAAAGRPPAGRAHEPPGHRIHPVVGSASAAIQGHGHRRHARPLLPGQRRRLDPGTGPRRRHPLEGQLLLLAGPEDETPRDGGKAGIQAPEDAGARAGMGPDGPEGPPGQAEGPSGRLRETRFRRCQAEGGEPRDLHPQRTAPGQQGHPVQRRVQGLRRQGPVRAPDLRTPAGRHRGRHRPERRRQDHPLPPDHARPPSSA